VSRVTRLDKGRLGAGRTGAGSLRAPAHVARTGVQEYLLPDGTVRREYRPADSVFHEDSLASLRSVPVTRGHSTNAVDPTNWATHAVGFASDRDAAKNQIDGEDWILTELIVSHADAVAAVEKRDLVEVSAGYSCELDFTPGVAPDGQRYDAVQRDINFNHIALLPAGGARAGSNARIRLDSQGHQTEQDMVKVTVNGIEYDQGSKSHLDAIAAETKREKTRADAAEAKIKTLEADAGAAAAKLAAAEKARTDATAQTSPEAVAALVADELAFRTDAIKLLPAEYDFAKKTRRLVKLDAIAHCAPDRKLDATATDAFVDGFFANLSPPHGAPVDSAEIKTDADWVKSINGGFAASFGVK